MPTLPSAAHSLARALPVEATALWLPLWLMDPLVGPWATGGNPCIGDPAKAMDAEMEHQPSRHSR